MIIEAGGNDWFMRKACSCTGASKPAFPFPVCVECGTPWELNPEFGVPVGVRAKNPLQPILDLPPGTVITVKEGESFTVESPGEEPKTYPLS